jgi:hypothetical protein
VVDDWRGVTTLFGGNCSSLIIEANAGDRVTNDWSVVANQYWYSKAEKVCHDGTS